MNRIRIAIPKGRNLFPSVNLFKKVGIDLSQFLDNSNRRLLISANERDRIEAIMVRDADIPTYVEKGGADIGISGSDQLAEQRKEIYEPVDLKFGFCRMVVAEPETLSKIDDPSKWERIKIATKFPYITEEYFKSRGVQIEVIKLYGSIELAPITNLAERIVDLVSTGQTLKENGLVEIEEIMKVTAKLVTNKASTRTKRFDIESIVNDIAKVIESGVDLEKI